MNSLYVQYGCGHVAPAQWINFDASPTLRIQRFPVVGLLLKKSLNTIFPMNVKYGDIVKGLPIGSNSCDGLFCSHTLEHLSLNDFRTALKNSYDILKPGGIFRCVLPDLEVAARTYISKLEKGNHAASLDFMKEVLLGVKQRPKGLKAVVSLLYGNSHHLWMWDHQSLSHELEKAGFKNIRKAHFDDSGDVMFKHVESKGRFVNAVAFECEK